MPIDDFIGALQNLVERCINKLKNARRIANRYDKTTTNYFGSVHIIPIRLWTRHFVNGS